MLENLYYSSPVSLQNVAVSLMGLRLRMERYTRLSRRYLAELSRTEFLTVDQSKQYQDKLLKKIIEIARDNLEFYGSNIGLVNSLMNIESGFEAIKNFPIVDKSILRENKSQFVNRNALKGSKPISIYTSGTTGTPLEVITTRNFRSKHYAFFSRVRKSYGLVEVPRRVTLFGRIIMNSDDNNPPFWRHDFSQNNLLMSSYHLNSRNLESYIDKLNSYKPHEVFSYPSSLFEISKFALKHGHRLPSVKLIMTTAERLLPYQRETIEKAFNSIVTNQYGCTEMAFFASECEFGVMHSHSEHGYLEVLKEDGTISDCGEGELLATGFVNEVMPVIRYKIGDRVTLARHAQCKCGRSSQMIINVDGRTDDVLRKKDGTPVGRLDPVFKGDFSIAAATIIQHENSDVEIQVIPDGEFSVSSQEGLKAEVKKRFGHGISVSVSLVEHLPKQSNGKHRAVIGKYMRDRK